MLSPLAALALEFRPGLRVLVHAGPCEPEALHTLLSANPALAEGVTFCGLFIPGVSRFDYAALTPSSRIETLFANPAFRAGRVDLLPIHYSAYPRHLCAHPADLALVHAPPARRGAFSCALAADVFEQVRRYARRVAVLVNPHLPFTVGGASLRVEEADLVVDAPAPLAEYPSDAPDEAARAIGARVAALVHDGDCVQAGIGKVPSAVLRALTGHRNLTLFGGMIVDEVVDLAAAGALAPGGSITTGIGVGSARLHRFVESERVAFRGIEVTHSPLEVARRAGFISINSAIEVDLFGAINCEYVRGRPVSGVGGGADYMRASQLAPGGRSVIALGARAKGSARIVPRLAPGTLGIARSDMDYLVTEFGTAHLGPLPVEARAQAIIALAAPEDRPALMNAWRTFRARPNAPEGAA